MPSLRSQIALVLIALCLTIRPVFGCGGTNGIDQLVNEPMGPNSTLIYDPANGRVGFWSGSAIHGVSTLEIISTSSVFIPDMVESSVFKGLFDQANERKLFKLDPAGFAHGDQPLEFGNVLPAGLSANFLTEDISFVAVCGAGQGSLYVVPEPSSLLGLTSAVSCLVAFRGRCRWLADLDK